MKVIGITDYYSTKVYKLVVEAKKQGRLPECDLISPNIEMRLNVATFNGSFVTLHLLVCPNDTNHLVELDRFLAKLSFALSRVPRSKEEDIRGWAMQFAKWLYSADHIHITYGVDYDGVDIRKLSPGTRGKVLLLLYLALDDEDDRPLIIDQPEENLDPKSIYDELVGLFVDTKKRRQVIIVTHNANLVVNADADQIIIASTDEHLQSGMPRISYLSGGLGEDHIRKEVCGILEGARQLFENVRKDFVSLYADGRR